MIHQVMNGFLVLLRPNINKTKFTHISIATLKAYSQIEDGLKNIKTWFFLHLSVIF